MSSSSASVPVAALPIPAWTWRNRVARRICAFMIRLFYRVEIVAPQHLPPTGGCLVVCNHVSFADGLILQACLPRPGRFLVDNRYVAMPLIGFCLRLGGVIPVAGGDRRQALLATIDAAVAAAKRGEMVVIFPEGKLSRSGQMDVFHRGMERVARQAGVPVVPAHLHGLWGGVFSRAEHRRLPRFRPLVELRLAVPEPADISAPAARDRVVGLGYEAAQARSDRSHRTLGAMVLRHARRHPLRPLIRDQGGVMSAWKLAGAARALLPVLGLARDERCVGVLLPPGRAGALINLALVLAGRTPVNLNHTAGDKQMARMCAMAGVRTVVTASAYTRRIGEPALPGRVLTCEDLLHRLPPWRVVLAALALWCWPARWLDRARPDDVAALVFSSGSTGDPKGVELTHRQIIANLDAVMEGLDLAASREVVCNPLPLFHSFGLVVGNWLALTRRLLLVAHPDPTDSEGLGRLVEATGATLIVTAPTFVRGWMRRVEPGQFRSLRLVVAGAERCPTELRTAFKARFGMDLLEGYGCTELAPTVAVNMPTVVRDGFTELRSREGSVGRALPGMHVFAIDPGTRTPLPPESEGLLVVRSPARMRGYLDRPDLTAAAFIHGGYNTGDMGRVDADGFVHITGRLARFAKIGGEMVPLDNVQAALMRVAGDQEVVVSAVPDASRGERLVVMHTGVAGGAEALLKALDDQPALWRPKIKDIIQVPSVPKLGTGKLDLGLIRMRAQELAG